MSMVAFMTMAQEVGSVVKDNVTKGDIPLIGEFQRQQSKFISEKKGGNTGGLPPWEGYENEVGLPLCPSLLLSCPSACYLYDLRSVASSQLCISVSNFCGDLCIS
jgi:hypothetical protein